MLSGGFGPVVSARPAESGAVGVETEVTEVVVTVGITEGEGGATFSVGESTVTAELSTVARLGVS